MAARSRRGLSELLGGKRIQRICCRPAGRGKEAQQGHCDFCAGGRADRDCLQQRRCSGFERQESTTFSPQRRGGLVFVYLIDVVV